MSKMFSCLHIYSGLNICNWNKIKLINGILHYIYCHLTTNFKIYTLNFKYFVILKSALYYQNNEWMQVLKSPVYEDFSMKRELLDKSETSLFIIFSFNEKQG